MKINLMNVRGAFLQVFEPKAVNGEGEPAYSGAWLIDPATPEGKANLARLEEAEIAVAKEKWGAKADTILKSIGANRKGLIHDGEEKAEYDGYPGNKFVNSRSPSRPLVMAAMHAGDKGKTPVTAADGVVYSGAYYNVVLDVWAQDNSYGKRINASLKGVQFYRPGDAFSGAGVPASEDDFDDLSDTGEGNDLV
jgi:hypothetical protein